MLTPPFNDDKRTDWSRLQNWVVSWDRRLGRRDFVVLVTLTFCAISYFLNAVLVVSFNGWAGMGQWENIVLPVIIPAVMMPCLCVPVLNILAHVEKLTESYRFLAEHDQLTGARNRHGLFGLADRLQVGTVVVIADVDRMKQINDEHGHHVGDEVLLAVVNQLRALIGGEVEIARLGGDEFAVLAPAGVGAARLPEITEVTTKHGVTATVSLGVSYWDGDLEEALARADHAMYLAKHRRAALHQNTDPLRPPVPRTPADS